MEAGFTDPNNSYAPTWAEFKGYLYISTSANPAGAVFSGSDKSGGDIWRTADGVTWEQIGSPGLGNPHNNLFQFAVFRDQLYAISNNLNDHGIEIWVTSDGTRFSRIEGGGFGDKNNDWAFPYVFQDRLILGLSNLQTGGEIWVSDDGRSFRQVVDGGMGDSGVTGFYGFPDPAHPAPLFLGKLYEAELWFDSTSKREEWLRQRALGCKRAKDRKEANMDGAAQSALRWLSDGNTRFAERQSSARPQPGEGQNGSPGPDRPVRAAVFSCSDPGASPELVFDQAASSLFVVRTAGPVLDDSTLGSLEFAVTEMAVPLVVVLGHQGCRAIKAAITRPTATGDLGIVLDAIEPAVLRARHEVGPSSTEIPDRAVEDHVRATVGEIRQSRVIHPYIDDQRVTVVGAVIEDDGGRVRWLE